MAEIVVEHGALEIHRFVVRGQMIIGRAPGADIHFDDRALSRHHARLEMRNGELFVVDLESQNGVFVNGLRISGFERVPPGTVVEIGRYRFRRVDAGRNAALDESTSPDDAKKARGPVASPHVEVLDPALLQKALPHVRIGRHFVFVDDAQAVMPPSGRMQRLLGYKQKKGRVVKPLADAPVEIAGARIHPVPTDVERLAGLTCDRDLYRAEQDVVRLCAVMPGGGAAGIRVTMNGAPFAEREIDLTSGLAIESLAMLLPGKYEARLVVGGAETGEPARFTVAEYTLAPLSARLLEHRLDRAGQTLSVTLAVESYAVPWDRPLRAALVERGREMSEIVLTMDKAGRFTGKARVVGDGPFKVRVAAVDDPARTADIALPGTRRAERQLTLAGELGKELFVSLLPEPNAVPVRGLFVTHGDFIATPVVVDDVIADRASLRANEDIESLVVAAYDPAADGWSVFELGDVPRGKTAEIDVPRPMCVAFIGCFVQGEPFEAFTSLFSAEKPVALEVPAQCAPGEELAITVHTGRAKSIPMLVCVRDERLTATDGAQAALAASTKRVLEAATAGLGDEFRFVKLDEIVPAHALSPSPTSSPPPPTAPQGPMIPRGTRFSVRVSERGGAPRMEQFDGGEISIGRVGGNDVVLPKPNISKRHTRIVLRDGKFIIVDLKSTNGTWLNGKKITSPQVLRDGDRVHIGDFVLELVPGPEETVYLGARGRPNAAPAPGASSGAAGAGDPAIPAPRRAPPPEASSSSSDDLFDEDAFAAPASRGADELDDDLPPTGDPLVPIAPGAAEDLLGDDGGDDDDLGELHSIDVKSVREDIGDLDESETRELKSRGPAKPAPAGPPPPKYGLAASTPNHGGATSRAAAEPPPIRATFPEVLFCGVVDVGDGDQIRIPAGDSLGAFTVEAFFVDGGDFGEAKARVQIDKPVRVDLDLAPEIDPDDRVTGVLRATSKNGGVRVSLVRDGRAVALRTMDGRVVGAGDVLPAGVELVFDAGPGVWLATVEDPKSGEIDAMEVRVGSPGVYRTLTREIVLLDKGKRIALDGDMLSLRVLPGIDEPFTMLAEATAGYHHMCCEQTAAKILSAVVMFLTAETPALRRKAEDVILSGIAREQSMYKKGRGFVMYPEHGAVSEYYTPKVVQHLWSLDGLAELAGLSRQLTEAVRAGIAMADDVAQTCGMKRVPDRVETIEDAYAIAIREPRRVREALELVARTVAIDESGPRTKAPTPRVAERATLAYAAAVLFASGKTQTAIRLANEVLRQLNEQGRLYSTVDSVAAIALMVQLRKTGVVGGAADIVVNGRAMAAYDAGSISDQVEVVEVKEGVAVVEVTRAREERWADARAAFPLKVGFRDDAGRSASRFRRGDKAELVVHLPKGYSEGDLVHVCLPPAMAWLEGGGRVKRFSADFEGRDELRIPVVVTHAIHGRQHFAVAVRNMFHEERIASPGLIVIEGA